MTHNIPILRCKSDPFGTDVLRTLEDARKVPTCPFEELHKGDDNNECAKETNDDWGFIKTRLNTDIKTAMNRNRSTTRWFTKVKGALAEFNPGKFLAVSKHSPEEGNNNVSTDGEETDNADNEQTVKFMFLLEIFEKLLANKWIKRAHNYKRMPKADEVTNFHTPLLLKAWYILRPMILFFFSFGFQSFLLHITTHFYILYMDREKGDNERQEEGGQLYDVAGNFVAEHFSGNKDISGEGAVYEGSVKIPLWLLDASAAIPLFFCVVTYAWALVRHTFNIGLWYKTYLVASLMAIMKGIFDMVTILPDSTGWENCTKRLTPEGLASLRNLDFFHDFLGSLFAQLRHEILGGGAKNGSRVRYCGDMMISGHTYFACLFSIAAYKQVAYNTQIPTKYNRYVRNIVFAICVLCILVEVSLVAAARFHYTVDMLASIVMVFMLYDSKCIEQISADWSEGYLWQDKQTFKANHRLVCRLMPTLADKMFRQQDETVGVVPSQSTLFNYRRFMGNRIMDEGDDDLDPDEPDPEDKDLTGTDYKAVPQKSS